MRTVYACQFDIVAPANETPAVCFTRARDAIAGWIRGRLRTKWAVVLGDVGFSSDRPNAYQPGGRSQSLRPRELSADDFAIAQLDWRHPHEEEGTFWSTLCAVAPVSDRHSVRDSGPSRFNAPSS